MNFKNVEIFPKGVFHVRKVYEESEDERTHMIDSGMGDV